MLFQIYMRDVLQLKLMYSWYPYTTLDTNYLPACVHTIKLSLVAFKEILAQRSTDKNKEAKYNLKHCSLQSKILTNPE